MIDIPGVPAYAWIAESAEEAWLNELADQAESEGMGGSVSLEEMAATLRARQG